jgi:hypothetical protein
VLSGRRQHRKSLLSEVYTPDDCENSQEEKSGLSALSSLLANPSEDIKAYPLFREKTPVYVSIMERESLSVSPGNSILGAGEEGLVMTVTTEEDDTQTPGLGLRGRRPSDSTMLNLAMPALSDMIGVDRGICAVAVGVDQEEQDSETDGIGNEEMDVAGRETSRMNGYQEKEARQDERGPKLERVSTSGTSIFRTDDEGVEVDSLPMGVVMNTLDRGTIDNTAHKEA